MKSWRSVASAVLALALLAGACGGNDTSSDDKASDSDEAKPKIVVGSADFAESSLVASIYAQALDHVGYDVTTKLDVGAREIYFEALRAGELTLVPDFVGSLTVYLKGEGSADMGEAMLQLEKVLPEGLRALEPSPAASANTFVVTKATADKHSLAKVSDLAGKNLTLGGPPECPSRPFCMQGLKSVYGIDFSSKFKPLDVGGPITKEALEKGDVDVALLFTTDPGIPAKGWVALEDDKELQQAENVVPIIAGKAATPEVITLLNRISEELDQNSYVELIGKVYIGGEDVEAVAKGWLEAQGFFD